MGISVGMQKDMRQFLEGLNTEKGVGFRSWLKHMEWQWEETFVSFVIQVSLKREPDKTFH